MLEKRYCVIAEAPDGFRWCFKKDYKTRGDAISKADEIHAHHLIQHNKDYKMIIHEITVEFEE